jgi:twitching motility protein PilT
MASSDRALHLEGVGRFRVHAYRAGDRPAAAIRVLPRSVPRLEELHFPVPLHELVQVPHGLVLVCGPTGSGKSATLAALAAEALRLRGGVLVSLEDPIEYALAEEAGASLVRQRQIGRDVRDFASGLRDALREDPDILLIGEMRDTESISLALTAAETGHLVLASLHSRSAAATVERIVDSYAPERQQQVRVQLADALRAVVAQRLLPRARGGGRVDPRGKDGADRERDSSRPQRGNAAARALPGRSGARRPHHPRGGAGRRQRPVEPSVLSANLIVFGR